MSRINDASLNQIGNVVTLYKYESFSQFVKVNPAYAGTSLSFTTSSPQLFSFLSNVDVSTVAFFSTAGPTASFLGLNLVIQAISNSSVVESKTYTVNINAGRFLQPTCNFSYQFYKNEPLGNNYLFVGSIPINKPVSTTSLPAGIGFVSNDICSYYLTGTPSIQYPSSNYNIIASDSSSRTINVPITIRVNAERLLLDISGTGVSSNATVNTDITPIVVTGRCPPYIGNIYSDTNIRYSWTPLPEGLRFTDSAGATLSNGGRPITDLSSTIILRGAPTNDAIRALTSSNYDISLTGTRVSLPIISSATNLRVRFAETVVFDTPVIGTLYKDASVNSSTSSNSFFAQTKFAVSGGTISNITSSNLPAGLTLDFSSNAQRAFLRGKPTTVSNYTSTIRAINSNAVFADLSVNFSVVADTITLTSTADACSTFIVGRALSNASTGYYKSPIRFSAASASGCNVTMDISGIASTGLTFTGSSGSSITYTLGGTPTSSKALTTALVTARVTDTSIASTISFVYSIIPDRFIFSDASINAIQNVRITPVRIRATTLSGLPVVWYSSSNIPLGLNLDSTGLVTGAILSSTSGTFNVRASTGFSIDSCSFPYYVSPDSIILFTPQSSYTYPAGANVSIPVTGLSYSGATVSNYVISGLPNTGLTIDSSSGLISGPLSDSIPPNPILPKGPISFDVCGYVGIRSGRLPATFSTTNPIVNRTFLSTSIVDFGTNSAIQIYTNDTSNFTSNWTLSNVTYQSYPGVYLGNIQVSDFKTRYTSVDSNTILATTTDSNGRFLRSSNSVDFYDVYVYSPTPSANVLVSSLTHATGTTWYAIARDLTLSPDTSYLYLKASLNDGASWQSVPSGGTRISSTGFTSLWPRDVGGFPLDGNAYLLAGSTIASFIPTPGSIFLLAGGRGDGSSGRSLMVSFSGGSSWTLPITPPAMTTEIASINTAHSDASRVIVATGSSLYTTLGYEDYLTSGTARTISYQVVSNSFAVTGRLWSNVSNFVGDYSNSTGDFNYFGYDITYGNGCWVASGISYYTTTDGAPSNAYYPEVRVASYSDPTSWSKIPFFNTHVIGKTSYSSYPYPLQIGPIMYDGSGNGWNVIVSKYVDTCYYPFLCTHAKTSIGGATELLSNWSISAINDLPNINSNVQSYRGFTVPNYIRTGVSTTSTITFQNTTGGPVFTSPSQTSYVFYQYMPIPEMTFSATGTGTVYLFVDSATLPRGLVWDPYAQKISGKTVLIETASFTVYAKDNVGITALTITVTTIIPRVIRQQTSAGAYTYLLRQYTEVNAAQNARDNRVTPTQDVPLGKFMSPAAPDVVSPSNCKC